MNKHERITLLNNDILNLLDEYNDLPIYELGYSFIRMASHMIYDLAPSKELADKTIQVSIEDGYKLHTQEDIQNDENRDLGPPTSDGPHTS